MLRSPQSQCAELQALTRGRWRPVARGGVHARTVDLTDQYRVSGFWRAQGAPLPFRCAGGKGLLAANFRVVFYRDGLGVHDYFFAQTSAVEDLGTAAVPDQIVDRI